MGERIIGYVDFDLDPHLGLLVVTDERFIVAWTYRHRLPFTFAPWVLVVGPILAERKAGRLEKLSPDEILSYDEHNFAIPFSDIVEVKLKGRFTKNIVIVTERDEYRMELNKEQQRHFDDQVLPYLADKLPIRRT